jgi:hypothetical protein
MNGSPPAAGKTANRPPVVDRVQLEPEEPVSGGRVRAVVTASDPDGGSVRLHYAWTLAGAPAGTDGPELALERARKGQELDVTVTASDGSAESAPVRARGEIGNRPPRLDGVALEPNEAIEVGARVKAVPDARDPDDDVVRYEVKWIVNEKAIPEEGLELDTKALHRGDRLQAEVRVSDGTSTSEAVRSPALEIANTAPKIVSTPELRFEGGVFQYAVKAKDTDGDRSLRYSLAKAPEGMSIDRLGGEIRWEPKTAQAGKHEIEVQVEDGHGGADVQTFVVTIGSEKGQAIDAPVPASRAAE